MQAVWDTLKEKLDFGSWSFLHGAPEGGFFCGRHVVQFEDFTSEADVDLYCSKLPLIPEGGASDLDGPLTETQTLSLMGTNGRLGWAARHGHPADAFVVSWLQQGLAGGQQKLLTAANTATRKCRHSFKIKIPDLGCALSEVIVVEPVDASHGAMPREGSQLGVASMFASPKILDGEAPVVLAEWLSTRMKRVVRSSMACEAGAVCVGMDHGDFLRAVLLELRRPSPSLRNWRLGVSDIPLYVVMDATTVFDALEGAGVASDRRVAIGIATLRESILDGTGAMARWLPGKMNPSDELTKLISNGLLSEVCVSGRWTLVETDELRKARRLFRDGLRERTKAAKELDSAK
jgi:hypothetical protein